MWFNTLIVVQNTLTYQFFLDQLMSLKVVENFLNIF